MTGGSCTPLGLTTGASRKEKVHIENARVLGNPQDFSPPFAVTFSRKACGVRNRKRFVLAPGWICQATRRTHDRCLFDPPPSRLSAEQTPFRLDISLQTSLVGAERLLPYSTTILRLRRSNAEIDREFYFGKAARQRLPCPKEDSSDARLLRSER